MIEKSRAAGASPEQIAKEVAEMERFMGSLQESGLQLSHHFLRGALSHGIVNHSDFSCDPEKTSKGSSRRRTTGQHSLNADVRVRRTNPIILYDGVCGLCNRLVQFLLKHDKHGRLRFASLQSEFAERSIDSTWDRSERSRHGSGSGKLRAAGRTSSGSLGCDPSRW